MFVALNSTDERTAWLNAVFLSGIVQSPLAASLVALSAVDLKVTMPDRGGGAEPCIIFLYKTNIFMHDEVFPAQ